MLDNIPDGTHCFVDANVIAYFIVGLAPFAPQCETFFKRVEASVISASTSAAMVSEATHKVMLAEAIEQHGLSHQGLAHRLQRKRDLITTLSKHQKVSAFLRALGIHVEPVTLDLIERAAALSIQHRLLTNDSITVASMEKLGLTHLATNDDNFDTLPGFTIWKPR
jgi:predicted nucleic acid-binding protein